MLRLETRLWVKSCRNSGETEEQGLGNRVKGTKFSRWSMDVVCTNSLGFWPFVFLLF